MPTNNDSNRAVVTPMLGAGVLGAGAYGNYKFDNFMDRMGLKKGLTLNPKAIKAIKEFGDLKLAPGGDPVQFYFDYARKGTRASGAQLFREDPRAAWEWFTNDRQLGQNLHEFGHDLQDKLFKLRTGNDTAKLRSKVEKVLGKKISSKLFNKIDEAIGDAEGFAGGVGEWFTPNKLQLEKAKSARKKALVPFLRAHEGEIARSERDALVRLLSEVAPQQGSAESLARSTAEALHNWKNVKGNFKTPLEYFNYLYHNTGKGASPNMFSSYLEFFKDVKPGKTYGDTIKQIRSILMPSSGGATLTKAHGFGRKGTFTKELNKSLGTSGKWKIDEFSGNLLRDSKDLKIPAGLKSPFAVRNAVRKSPILTWLATQVGRDYSGQEFGRLARMIQKIQFIRSPKLRLALGLGSLGLGGLGVTNFIRNRKDK